MSSEVKSGVILAGGNGTRLGHNRPYNKHLSLVYDRPMIEYPVQTMKAMGVEHIKIVTSPTGSEDFYNTYGSNIEGVGVSYAVQELPNGAADALDKARFDAIGRAAFGDVFMVLCGDVYLDPAPQPPTEPTLYWHEFEGASNHSVWNPETNEIIEKPSRDIGKRAIIAYAFDDYVFEVIPTLQPSARGELELVDIYKAYIERGVKMVEYQGFFGDMGTPDGLLRVANHVQGL